MSNCPYRSVLQRPDRLTRCTLRLLSTLLLMLTWLWLAAPVQARESSEDLLLGLRSSDRADLRAQPHLREARLAEPEPVRGWPEMSILYQLRPLVGASGQVIGLVAEDADTGGWLWYSFGCAGNRFPAVSAETALELAQARAAASGAGGDWEGPSIVRMPDRHLYWLCALRDGTRFLVDVDRPTAPILSDLDGSAATSEQIAPGPARCAPPAGHAPRPRTLDNRPLPVVVDIQAVPFHYQQTSWYCGCAAVQMLLDFYGQEINQADIGDVENESISYGTYATDNRRACHFSGLSTAIQDPSLRGYVERSLGYAGNDEYLYLDPEGDLKRTLAEYTPVEILTCYDGYCTEGHFRVVKGYDDTLDEFIVHDPWYGAPYYGPEVHFNQDFLIDEMWLPWSGGWALTSGPWEILLDGPTEVTPGEQFDLEVGVRYPGSGAFSGMFPSFDATAAIQLPAGFSLASGGTTIALPVFASGDSAAHTWQVIASQTEGPFEIKVRARGRISGSSYSYPSYTDSIGGIGIHPLWVGEPPGFEWTAEERLTADPAGSALACTNGRSIFVQPDGTVHVVWSDTRDGNGEIYYRKRTSSWGPETRLTVNAMLSEQPVITGTISGDLHVAWVDGRSGVKDIYAMSYTGGSWSSEVNVSQTGVAEITPTLAVDTLGRVHLAWERVSSSWTKIYYARREGGLWSTPSELGGVYGRCAYMPSLAAPTDGTVFLFYEQDLPNRIPGDILYRVLSGATWSPATELTTASSYSRVPCAAAGEDGSVHVVWYDGRDGSGDIYYRIWDGSSWGSEILVAGGPEDSQFPSVAAGSMDLVQIVWQEFRDGDAEIYHRAYDGQWQAEERLTQAAGMSAMPCLGIDGMNRAYLVWNDLRDGNPEIYHRRRVPSTTDVLSGEGQAQLRLLAVHPSPAVGWARVSLALSAGGPMDLAIYDVTGRRVRTLLRSTEAPGTLNVDWDGRDDRGRPVAGGWYLVRAVTGGTATARSLMWLRP